MMRRVVMLIGVGCLAAVFFYLSRFWYLSLWERPGLFGTEALRPQGDLISLWLRETALAPFELLIWALGCFAILTGLQTVHDRSTRTSDAGEHDEG